MFPFHLNYKILKRSYFLILFSYGSSLLSPIDLQLPSFYVSFSPPIQKQLSLALLLPNYPFLYLRNGIFCSIASLILFVYIKYFLFWSFPIFSILILYLLFLSAVLLIYLDIIIGSFMFFLNNVWHVLEETSIRFAFPPYSATISLNASIHRPWWPIALILDII